MDRDKSEIRQILLIQQIVLHSILPVICSSLIGFLFYRWRVFSPYSPAFQFVQVAAVASIFFYSLVYARTRNAYAVLLILFLLTLLITRSTRPMWILRDLVETGGIAAAVLLYARLVRTNSVLQHQYFGLMFSGIFGLCNTIAWSLQLFFVQYIFSKHQPVNLISFISMAASYGFLIGLGVGVGIVINRRVLDDFKSAKNAF
jgi:hypothetical protein